MEKKSKRSTKNKHGVGALAIKGGKQNGDSHVSQSGTEVLVDVGFQDGVEVLEFDVANQCYYKYLVINKRRTQNQSQVQVERTYIDCISVGLNF